MDIIRSSIWVAAFVASGPLSICRAGEPLASVTPAPWYDHLVNALNEENFQAAQRSAKFWIRDQFASEEDLAVYGLRPRDGWEDLSGDRPVVVLIHGFNSTPDTTIELFAPVLATGYPCATFAYPNDHALAESAELLSHELKRFARQHPARRVVLLCHSMGSLVARACVEDPTYDPGNVDRLIMVAPPNHGSLLATISIGTDVWEHWIARAEGWPWTRLHDSIVDGLGEAIVDLCPGSDFLMQLNERPRNPRIEYSILLGTTGVMTAEEMRALRESTRQTLAWVPSAEESAERLDAFLGDFTELIHGEGDGVVAVSRGRLKGVGDTVLLPFGHLKVTDPAERDEIRRVHQAVLERID